MADGGFSRMNCSREWAALQRTRTMLAILPFGSSPLACRSAATAESRDGHFHFDVCTDGVIVEDKDGLDLLNAATARLEAVRAAAEMMKDRCADMAQRADLCIAVRTQSLEPVCTVQVALRIR